MFDTENQDNIDPCTARRMIREAKYSPRITVGELQRKVPFWGYQLSKTMEGTVWEFPGE